MSVSAKESGADQFRELPEQIRLEDTIASVPSAPADPDAGRNIDADRALGHREFS